MGDRLARLPSGCRNSAPTDGTGTRGPGAGSIHLENKAMQAKVAPRLGFDKYRLFEFESLRIGACHVG